MGMAYTQEQQRVIDLHGKNILVSAAAGSGKTAVLTQRIVKMVSDGENPVDIDRLLVVTFTNAAAAEMRERIGAAIAAKLEEEPDNEHLQKQATLIHNAQITTIDSFCMYVIRNNFNDIGLDPGFRVADEGELKLLRQDVMQEFLEERFAQKEEWFLHCVEYFSTGNQDKAIEGHILKLYQFAESNPWPEEWLEQRKKDYGVNTMEELEQAEFMQFGMEQARLMAQDCVRKIQECMAVCEQPDGPYMYAPVLEKEADGLEKLAKVSRYGEGYALFHGMAFGRLPSKKDDSVSAAKRGMVQEIRKDVKDALKKICAKYFPVLPETALAYMKGSREAVCGLIDLTLGFKQALDQRKREENIIDFSDMERLALSILVQRTQKGEKSVAGEEGDRGRQGQRTEAGMPEYSPTRTALDYREFFTEILIDEYQDSNPVQEMLLESISGESAGRYNRFMVGDVKQSIYKFRLARPEIFMEKYEEYGNAMGEMAGYGVGAKADEAQAGQGAAGREAGALAGRDGAEERDGDFAWRLVGEEADVCQPGQREGEKKERIDLHKNFRSRKEVLDSVNYLFAQIMGKKLGGVEYNEETALYCGAEYPAWEEGQAAVFNSGQPGSPNCTELLLVRKKEEGVASGKKSAVREEGKEMDGDSQAAGEEAEGGQDGDGAVPLSGRQQEALAVAKRIKELLAHFQVTDKESRTLRPVRYQDIVILLRTNAGWDEDFKSILKEEGIPAHVSSKTGYFAAREIQTLLQLLRILDNPRQDIPLFGVMKSCFGGFTDEEIAQIRACAKRGKCLYFALKEFVQGKFGEDRDFLQEEAGQGGHGAAGKEANSGMPQDLAPDMETDSERPDRLLLDVETDGERLDGLQPDGKANSERPDRLLADGKANSERLDGLLLDGKANSERPDGLQPDGERLDGLQPDGKANSEGPEPDGLLPGWEAKTAQTALFERIWPEGGAAAKWRQAEGAKPEEKASALAWKVRKLLDFLEGYRDKTVYMPVHELLQDILSETNYLPYVAALPGGGQRKANVQILLEKASAFEQTSYYGLFHFVRYIEQLEKYDVDYGEANVLDENADVVRIMSIHKSKGLEFPVCFVCGLAKKFNMQDLNSRMAVDVDMGIGVDYVDVENRQQSRTVRKNIVAEKMRLDNLGEELRVLYVALTRAKEKLILTGVIEKPEKRIASLLPAAMRDGQRLPYGELAAADCYLDFLLPALCRHPAFAPVWGLYGLEAPKRKRKLPWEAPFSIHITGADELFAADIAEQAAAEGARFRLEHPDFVTDIDNELMTYMSEVFSYQYEYANLADLYTKTTVSELKKAGQEEEQDFSFQLYEEETVIPYIPRFMQEEEDIGGAGRGSAFHKVMELFQFSSAGKPGDVEAQIAHMVREGMLGEEYAKAVSVSAVEAFLRTSLAKRMKRAQERGLLHREQPFVLGLAAKELNEKFPEGELVLIQGIIDVYFEEDGEIVVADYKTDRVERGQELVGKYKTQLDYYARALEELTGKRVKEKIIYSFGLREEICL